MPGDAGRREAGRSNSGSGSASSKGSVSTTGGTPNSPQRLPLGCVERSGAAIEHQEQREGDARFAGCDCHDEKYENLAMQIAVKAPKATKLIATPCSIISARETW